MKISKFKALSSLNVGLISATIAQFGGKESFKESAEDVNNHGIDGGFGGFIYYTETTQFAKNNLKEIMNLAESLADDLGVSGSLELIAGFGCLNGLYSQSEISEGIHAGSASEADVLNALAWFAAESVCREYCDLKEEG
jgi:hypothetical protein